MIRLLNKRWSVGKFFLNLSNSIYLTFACRDFLDLIGVLGPNKKLVDIKKLPNQVNWDGDCLADIQQNMSDILDLIFPLYFAAKTGHLNSKIFHFYFKNIYLVLDPL